ncbi:MAG TPA: heavy metal-associated domain-containing protein [Streptosporangiaceae bacterium]|nr:heavy metal-associated domain-containing protein [Streptosporangiaceae bacterium]
MVTTTAWKVSGMTCQGCANTLQAALGSRLPGGTEVTADHEAGMVTISSLAEIGADDVKDAVERAGFDFGGRSR